MLYGLTESEIVSSFSGAVSGDFAVAPLDGYTVINQEIEFQWEKLKLSMSDKVSTLLTEINYEVPSISGGNIFVPGLYAIPSSLEVWKVDRCAEICGKESFKGCNSPCGCGIRGSMYPYEDRLGGIQKLVVNTDYTSNGSNIYSLTETINSDNSYIVISYLVDEANVSLTSLSSILRDMVCANLGNRLFAAIEGNKWSIVEHYEGQAEKWLGLLEKGWMPPELKKMNIMFQSGIKSIKTSRA
jgi:hypothetical protein